MAITQDYLLRQLISLAAAIREALRKRIEKQDAQVLDATSEAIDIALGIDSETLLRMDPASFVSMMRLVDVDPEAAAWVAAALEIQSEQHAVSDNAALSALRFAQAEAVRRGYDVERSIEELLDVEYANPDADDTSRASDEDR